MGFEKDAKLIPSIGNYNVKLLGGLSRIPEIAFNLQRQQTVFLLLFGSISRPEYAIYPMAKVSASESTRFIHGTEAEIIATDGPGTSDSRDETTMGNFKSVGILSIWTIVISYFSQMIRLPVFL
jgi:hypothetical protein